MIFQGSVVQSRNYIFSKSHTYAQQIHLIWEVCRIDDVDVARSHTKKTL